MTRLLHVFSTFAAGGPQLRTTTLINRLGDGFEHIILAMDGNLEAGRRIEAGRAWRPASLSINKGYGLSPANLRRLRGLLARERPDLLLTYNFGAMEAALANRFLPRCRHIHFEEGFGPEEAAGRQLPRRVWLRRLALSGRSLVVVPSRTLERIALECWRLAARRVRYVPNGIDIDRFARAEPLPDLRRQADERLIGSIGILRAEKRFDRLLRVFAALDSGRPLRLVIAGDGPERPRLETLADELGCRDRVLFTGFTPAPERILAALDVFVLSSDTEQMPYSLVEAMAAGLPVAATDVGDVRLMLPESSRAAVVGRKDEAALSTQLRALLDDSARRRDEGRANQAHARAHYALDTMLDRYRAMFAAGEPV